MITYNQDKKELKVIVPLESITELHSYQRGLLGVLAEIQIKECSETLKGNIKSVYKLLKHFLLDTGFLNQHEFFTNECKALMINGKSRKL
ncbi:hypothetical protein JMN32_08520 [Fulvivirga sp. 29W222]|uniref:Uncharacterized protein n=1 Tax=Fulvivirga marina TaxID=2494733 RepID=A0A937FUU5_9BACT|nr:hypothetical protein [Fulvivirga marina]MBL6446349.1 hypothetical protein [Fulvivirga marina]